MKRRRWLWVVLALALILAVAPFVSAAGGAYDISWYTFAGGGGESSSAVYALNATAGITEAGGSQGSTSSLLGGYWVEFWENVFTPIIVK